MQPISSSFALCAVCAFALAAQAEPAGWQVTGIINLPDYKGALITGPPSHPSAPRLRFLLSEGQRANEIQLLQIIPEKRLIKLSVGDSNLDLSLPPYDAEVAGILPPFALQLNTDLQDVLTLYSRLAKRTVLSPQLPDMDFKLASMRRTQVAAVSALTNALKANGLSIILDGEKLALVLPDPSVPGAKPRSAEVAAASLKSPAEIDLNFEGVTGDQALDYYALLAGTTRIKLTAGDSPPAFAINLRTTSPLTKEEALYALDTLFLWNGVKVVRTGDNRIKLVRVSSK